VRGLPVVFPSPGPLCGPPSPTRERVSRRHPSQTITAPEPLAASRGRVVVQFGRRRPGIGAREPHTVPLPAADGGMGGSRPGAGAVFRSRGGPGGDMLGGMADVTQILSAIEQGDPHAAAELLPLVYDELRKLAAARLAGEKPGQTLQPTALVHEAYLRLVGGEHPQGWDGRGHFFAAAAEAMRRILVEAARRKATAKRGGDLLPLDVEPPSP